MIALIIALMSTTAMADCGGFFKKGKHELRWEKIPIEVNVKPKDTELLESTRIAIIEWEKATGLNLFTLKASNSTRNEIIIKKKLKENKNGNAKVFYFNKFIDTFEMHIADKKRIDKISVLVHELGHVLGLDHSTGIMAPRLGKKEIKRKIDKKSTNKIKCMYGEKNV